MYKVTLVNLKTNNTFEKIYESFFSLRKFLMKCKFSKKVKVCTVDGLQQEELLELSGLF